MKTCPTDRSGINAHDSRPGGPDTPRIGDLAPDGRSHWPALGLGGVAGGGSKSGQVVGAIDARSEKPVGRPIRMQNVMATMYNVLGIEPATTLADYTGRPQNLLDDREPVAQLL